MIREILDEVEKLTPEDRVVLARHPKRPHLNDYLDALFTDFFEQKGDHLYGDDRAVLGGIARYKGIPVTVIGQQKGRNVQENVELNFGMARPEGYRKALRMMNQAQKFGRPIITFIDTPGAYPGKDAEEHGIGEAIARNMAAMSAYTVPIITIVTGEGSSGGALGLAVCNRLLMLENAVYSVLSPEGFASILWKDASRSREAAELMKLTSKDLLDAGICDRIIPEPAGGAHINPEEVYSALDKVLEEELLELLKQSPEELRNARREKFRCI